MEHVTLNAKTGGMVARRLAVAIRQSIFFVAAVGAVSGLGLYLNWPAIVALGLAPLVLAIAPCVLMCAVGLCGITADKNKSDSKPPSKGGQP